MNKLIIVVLCIVLIVLTGCDSESRVVSGNNYINCQDYCLNKDMTMSGAFVSSKSYSCVCEKSFMLEK